jgi:uncharacterized protein
LRSIAVDGVEVKRDRTGSSLYAVRPFAAGETVFAFERVTWGERDSHTVEHPNGGHFRDPVLIHTAHSCAPNCRVSFEAMSMVALREIAVGEAISFDYATTESAITQAFDCLCGAPSCRGRIE